MLWHTQTSLQVGTGQDSKSGHCGLDGSAAAHLIEEWEVEEGNSFIAQEGGVNFS